MKSGILLLFFSFTLSLAWSQSIDHANEVTIENSFDKKAIQAYAVQAQVKVEEFVEYLNLIQDPKNSDELNKQLKQTIMQLFSPDETILVIGGKNKTLSTDLAQWIEDWKHSNLKINSLELITSNLESSYWINEYQLNYQLNETKKGDKMSIQIYFKPQSKKFGKTAKTVWDFKIGHVLFFLHRHCLRHIMLF